MSRVTAFMLIASLCVAGCGGQPGGGGGGGGVIPGPVIPGFDPSKEEVGGQPLPGDLPAFSAFLSSERTVLIRGDDQEGSTAVTALASDLATFEWEVDAPEGLVSVSEPVEVAADNAVSGSRIEIDSAGDPGATGETVRVTVVATQEGTGEVDTRILDIRIVRPEGALSVTISASELRVAPQETVTLVARVSGGDPFITTEPLAGCVGREETDVQTELCADPMACLPPGENAPYVITWSLIDSAVEIQPGIPDETEFTVENLCQDDAVVVSTVTYRAPVGAGAAVFTVEARDAGGDRVPATTTITVAPDAQLDVDQASTDSTTLAPGESVLLTVRGSGGEAPYDITFATSDAVRNAWLEWVSGGSTPKGVTREIARAGCSGVPEDGTCVVRYTAPNNEESSELISVEITDRLGNTATSTIPLIVKADAELAILGVADSVRVDPGGSTLISAIISGGTVPYTVNFAKRRPAAAIIGTQETQLAEGVACGESAEDAMGVVLDVDQDRAVVNYLAPVEATSEVVTIWVCDNVGNTATTSVVLTVASQENLNITANPVSGQLQPNSVTPIEASIIGGTPPYTVCFGATKGTLAPGEAGCGPIEADGADGQDLTNCSCNLGDPATKGLVVVEASRDYTTPTLATIDSVDVRVRDAVGAEAIDTLALEIRSDAFGGGPGGGGGGSDGGGAGPVNLRVDTSSAITCPSQTVTVTATATGGAGGNLYTFSIVGQALPGENIVPSSETTASTAIYTAPDPSLGQITLTRTINVEVREQGGSSDSADVQVFVQVATEITHQPSNAVNCAGQTANFSISAEGTNLSYQWQFDDGGGVFQNLIDFGDVSGATTPNLQITNVSVQDEGPYRCVVTGACGALTSAHVALIIDDNTGITTDPADLAKCPGESAVFTVVATAGTSGLMYQWQFNDGSGFDDLANGGDIAGVNTNGLTISNVDAADAGRYRCVVEGPCSVVVSDDATLTVDTVTAINTHPANANVCDGETANFCVTAQGTGRTYQWQYNDGGGFVNLVDTATNGITGSTASCLAIADADTADEGDYQCIVSGACGLDVTSNQATLTIDAALTITGHPQDVSDVCPDDDNIQFSVTAQGAGLTYQWQSKPAGSGAGFQPLSESSDFVGTKSHTLTINNVIETNAGQYRCAVGSDCGNLNSDPATLTVNGETEITGQPTDADVCEGNTATFSVVASGASLTYQWQFDDGPGQPEDLANSNGISGAKTPTLQIANVDAADEGEYRCVVSGGCNPSGPTPTSDEATLTLLTGPDATITTTPSTVWCDSTGNIAQVTPAGNTYVWTISGGSITIGQGTPQINYTASSGPTVTIGITVTDGDGCQASDSVDVTVDHVAVTNVSSTTPDGIYGTDDVVVVTVKFDRGVTVNGTPLLELETGTVDQQAVFTGTSSATVLEFSYTVQAGDTSLDLDYTGTGALTLPGGATIQDATTGCDADVTLPLPGDPGSLGDNKAIEIETAPPAAVVATTAGDPTNLDTIPFTVNFGEEVTDFVKQDIDVTNGSVTGGSFTDEGGGLFSFDVNPTADGLVTVTVPDGVCQDLAGNDNTQGSASTTYDGTAPAASVATTASDPTNLAPIPFTVDFGEEVTGFAEGDVEVTNGAVTAASFSDDGGGLFSFTIDPTADGLVTVTVADSICQDLAGNDNTQGSASTTYDGTAPPAVVATTASDPTNLDPIPFTVDFGEEVTGFAEGDIGVTNGAVTAASFSDDGGGLFSFTIDPTADGSVTVTVADAVCQDLPGNDNTQGSASTTYDGTAPPAVVATTASDPTNLDPIPFTVDFGEEVTGFAEGDIGVTNGAVTAASFSDDGGGLFSFTIDPTADGSVTVTVADAVCQDLPGNDNTQGSASTTYDGTEPGAAVATTASDPTNLDPIPFTVDFGEEVTGFAESDIGVTNGAVTAASFSDDGGGLFSFTIDPTADGLVTVTVADAVCQDLAGNDNTQGSAATTYDGTLPTITGGTLAIDNSYVDVSMSEGVYDDLGGPLEAGDFAVVFTANGGTATAADIDGATKTDDTALTGGETEVRVLLSITGTPSGDETVAIGPSDGNSIFDEAGNPMDAGETTGELTLNP